LFSSSRRNEERAALRSTVLRRSVGSRDGKEDWVMAAKKHKSAAAQANLATIIDECNALLEKAIALFGDSPALSPLERVRMPKGRKELGDTVEKLARLADQYGVTLPSHSTAKMVADWEHVRTLQPLLANVAKLHRKVEDDAMTAGGATWVAATAFYTTLRRVRGVDGNLAASLAEIAGTFRTRSKSKKASSDTPAKPADGGAAAPSPSESNAKAGDAGATHA
jgi:hypothetical protein